MTILEIHGANTSDAQALRTKIFNAASIPLQRVLVIEIILSNIENHREEKCPYLKCTAHDRRSFREVQRVVTILQGRYEIPKMPLLYVELSDAS